MLSGVSDVRKFAQTQDCWKDGDATTNMKTGCFTGCWRGTNPITSVKLYPSAGNFVANSLFTAYVLL